MFFHVKLNPFIHMKIAYQKQKQDRKNSTIGGTVLDG